MIKTLAAIGFAVLLLAAPAQLAQAQAQPAHSGMGHDMRGGEMGEAMERMNRGMQDAPMTGNPDRDFTAMMIPHHQGAIDMARLYLRDCKDPGMRRMAQKIIADQEREIREMRAWQAARR